MAWRACVVECGAWRAWQQQGAGGISPCAMRDSVPPSSSSVFRLDEAGNKATDERDDTVGASCRRCEVVMVARPAHVWASVNVRGGQGST
jgi:hypothetical protein